MFNKLTGLTCFNLRFFPVKDCIFIGCEYFQRILSINTKSKYSYSHLKLFCKLS